MPKSSTSTPRLPAHERRRQLLDVAEETFATGGFHATSMDDIAMAAGVTKPVLYQHFSSKKELYLELIDDVGARLLETITERVVALDSPRDRVQTGFQVLFAFVEQHAAGFQLLFEGDLRDAEVQDRIQVVADTITADLARFIQADIDDDHRMYLAVGMLGMAIDACRHWLLQRSLGKHESADVTARRMADMAWGGLRGISRV